MSDTPDTDHLTSEEDLEGEQKEDTVSDLDSQATRLKYLRSYLQLSQSQFAVRINKTPGFISLVENGRCKLSENSMRRISDTYGVNVDWLRTGQGVMIVNDEEAKGIDRSGISERIKKLRKDRKMTIDQFAAEIPCSRNQIIRIEAGTRIPSEQFLQKVADAFFVSFEWLLRGKRERIEENSLDRVNHYLANDSVALSVVLEAMDMDRSIWLKLDRVIQKEKGE